MILEEMLKHQGELEAKDLRIQELSKLSTKQTEVVKKLTVENKTFKTEITTLKKDMKDYNLLKKKCADLTQQLQSRNVEEKELPQQVKAQSSGLHAASKEGNSGGGRRGGKPGKCAVSSEDVEDELEEELPPPPENKKRGSRQITVGTEKNPTIKKRASDSCNDGNDSSVDDDIKSRPPPKLPLRKRHYSPVDHSDDDENISPDENNKRGRQLQPKHQPLPLRKSSGSKQVSHPDQRANFEEDFNDRKKHHYRDKHQKQSASPSPPMRRRQQHYEDDDDVEEDDEDCSQDDRYYPAKRRAPYRDTQPHPKNQHRYSPPRPRSKQRQHYSDDRELSDDKEERNYRRSSNSQQPRKQASVESRSRRKHLSDDSHCEDEDCYSDERRGKQRGKMPTPAVPHQRSGPSRHQQQEQLPHRSEGSNASMKRNSYYG